MNQCLRRIYSNSLAIIFLVIILTACSGKEGGKEEVSENPTPAEQPASGSGVEEQIVEKLDVPWSITNAGRVFYISERNGTIVSVNKKTGEKIRLPVRFHKKLFTGGEGGLLGIEIIPGKEVEAFAYHTYEENGNVFNRLIRIKKEKDAWIETALLLEGIPGSQIHNGGRIKIGPDGKLYVTAGDASKPESAQKLDHLSGKILRLELDGTIPADNPFPGSFIYSYGHRNPQGLAWNEEGQLFATEHGQSAHDEINKIEPGKNYGWPKIQGDEKKTGMETPIFHTNGDTWAPSGTAYHDGKLYIASLRGEAVRVYDLKIGEVSILSEGNGRIRDVIIEDGALYFVTNNTDGRGTPAENDDRHIKIELK
ncbi:PQQ-dependent sugar dehydrogenase [Lederbergia citrea]|uniref:PQQ-dependent sugar dehydrogenase n=1 Tax=Lederbergia citrea TaxID=2833581 RepID=UPI001BCA0B7D|nr:PQQ-dependent sugar dehydrogenase [Lederbergia citrea]MBS4176096.1 PQQ-dependent sugar dehydrogenase [Lederbergia citrea]